MRTSHKAALARHDAALELVLEHHRGAEILAASGGDAEHALRVIEELKHRAPETSNVIRLPREPILDFNDVLADVELIDLDRGALPFPLVVAVALGLAAWAAIAAVGFAAYELVSRLTA